jgi:hypothetical protein
MKTLLYPIYGPWHIAIIFVFQNSIDKQWQRIFALSPDPQIEPAEFQYSFGSDGKSRPADYYWGSCALAKAISDPLDFGKEKVAGGEACIVGIAQGNGYDGSAVRCKAASDVG